MARIRHVGVARLLGAVLALQVLYVGATMGVTCDECGHFGGGIFLWDYSRFDVYRVNPPLVRALAGAPAALFGIKREYRSYNEGPAVRVEWRMGQDMIAANPTTWEWYFVWGRWAVLPFVLVGAYFVYRWTCELYGTTSGLVALALWCFCPNVVAWERRLLRTPQRHQWAWLRGFRSGNGCVSQPGDVCWRPGCGWRSPNSPSAVGSSCSHCGRSCGHSGV